MSRFPDKEEKAFVSGREVGGAFECNICQKVVTQAIHNSREQRLYWKCPDGHENSINFRI